MTLPRELSIKDGRLYQKPIKELATLRKEEIVYRNVALKDGETSLDGVEGRTIEMDIEISPQDKEKSFDKFIIELAQNDKFHTSVTYRPKEDLIEVDRSHAGSRRTITHQKKNLTEGKKDSLKARFILDRYSIEIFLNDGMKTITTTIPTSLDARGISFKAVGGVVFDVLKYSL